MKKLILLLASILLIFSLMACQSKPCVYPKGVTYEVPKQHFEKLEIPYEISEDKT